jgi:hypothetical protein
VWQENSRARVALEDIEQTLADREETDGGTWKESRSNKRLVSQRRERTHLEVADFSLANSGIGFLRRDFSNVTDKAGIARVRLRGRLCRYK